MTQIKWTKIKQEPKKRSKKESKENENKNGIAHNFINSNLSVFSRVLAFGEGVRNRVNKRLKTIRNSFQDLT